MSAWWVLGLLACACAGYLLGDAAGTRRGGRVPRALRSAAEAVLQRAGRLGFSAPEPGPPALAAGLERFGFWIEDQWARSAEERGRLLAVLSGLTEGIVLTDAYGRVLLANRVAEGLWPTLAPRLRGRHQIELFADAGLDRALGEALTTGRPREIDIERPGPPRRFWRMRVLPLEPAPAGAAEGTAGLLVVAQDITGQRAVEQIRRDFVANVSHELQTPLTSVRGYAETLRDGDLGDAERARFLDHILREAERMAALVRDLLALAQVEAPRWAPPQPLALDEVVSEAVAAETPLARARGVALLVEAGPLALTGRADELRRAVSNLIRNAVAATGPGGRVSVTVSRRGAEALIEVADTGSGIPAEALPRIFERFYRVDQGRSRATGGTGLGLAIVRHTAEGHGGRVEVTSTPGRGSVFTLVLPAPGGDGEG